MSEHGNDFVVVANRLPVDLETRPDGSHTWTPSPGGLVTALSPALEIGLGELDWVQQHAGIGAEGLWRGIGHTGPAHPASLV